MVKGLDTFREYFKNYADNYIIIGKDSFGL
jgi:hypothetical protein